MIEFVLEMIGKSTRYSSYLNPCSVKLKLLSET
jgi:hypothetical protein